MPSPETSLELWEQYTINLTDAYEPPPSTY